MKLLKKILSLISVFLLLFYQMSIPLVALAREATPSVVTDHLYVAPQNDKVTVKFNKLPENPGKLNIQEVTLTDEQVNQIGALSNIAYDISSDMENGTFEYTLTLPTPKTENVEVKASEDGQTFVTLGGVSAQEDIITITGLNHFTVFVVVGTVSSGVATPFDESASSVVINEFVYHPATGNNEWVELFNKTSSDISLTGWTLVDAIGTSKSLSGTIPASGILVYENTGAAWLNNLSSNGNGDKITLINNLGSEVNKVTYQKSGSTIVDAQSVSSTNPSAGQSIARTSDGGTTWSVATTPTKGWFNGSPAPSVSDIVGSINLAGITTNWGTGAIPNSSSATGLYFEKAGKGRITFSATLNLTSQNTKTLLQNLSSKLEMADAGEIAFDAQTAQDLKNAGATLAMYGMDSLGITDTPALIVKDDNGVVIAEGDSNYPSLSGLNFVSADDGDENGGTFTFTANHFTGFELKTDVYVSATGTDDVGTGSQTNPYGTIQKGIASTPNNGTVHILAGSYDEVVNVSKNITIKGAGNTTIWEETSGEVALTITTGTVTVENINFSNADTAIAVSGGNATIKNSQISGNGAGISVGTDVSLVTASHNYWGAGTGPTHSTNSGGSGDSISDKVKYRPFYTDSARTALSSSTLASSNFNPATFFSSGIFSLPSGTTNQASTPSVSVNQQLTMTVALSGGTSKVILPSGTVISKAGGGNIDSSLIAASNVSASSLSGFASGTTVDGALQWGIPDLGLEFSQAITLNIFVGVSLNGQTLNVQRSTDTSSGWTSEGIASPATCVVSEGICSFQATKASYYATSRTVTSSSSTSSTQTLSPAGGGGTTPVCNDAKPGGVPALISAITGTNSVTLNWNKALNPVTYYLATYGLSAGAQQYGNPNIGGPDTTSYTVSGLSGATSYYFKVRAGNGCAPGDFSNELSATPGGEVVSGPAVGFAPGVLGISTPEAENVGIGKDEGQVQGETKASEQVSKTSQSETKEPFDAKILLIVVVTLLFGFGVFKLIIK